MKKQITFAIGILLLSSAFAMAADLLDMPRINLDLKKGWNMVPAFGGPGSYGGSCIDKLENAPMISYIFNPLNKKYFLTGPYSQTSEYKNLAEKGYYAAYYTGIWLYVPENCNIWMNDFIGPSNFKIARGWQFVVKRKWADDFSIFKNCNIEKFNKWDNEEKKWAYAPSSTSIADFQNAYNQATIGEVFSIKFSSECMLDEMEITSRVMPQPPALE